MNTAWRRVTYLTFFLIFFIAAPFLIFYSLGYRYNFDKHIVEKNGAFFIKSYPRNAEIFIDQIKTRYKTPSQITNTKPGQYLVAIKKENYHTWHKALTVHAGQTSFVEEAALFLIDNDKTALGLGSSDFIINQHQNKYSHLIDNDLWLTNVDLDKSSKIFSFTNPVELISWSFDDQKLLIKQGTYKLFNLQQQKITTLNIGNPDKIIWDNQDANVLWFLDKDKLYRHNTILNTTALKTEDIQDFAITGEYLILQNNQNLSSTITQVTKNITASDDEEAIHQLNHLNVGKLKILLADNDYLIFMLGSKLYIQRSFDELISIPASLVKIYGKFLLINDGHQTILYDYNEKTSNIINRSSKITSDIYWHPNGSYFMDEIDGLTTIYELDGRDYRNNTQILDDPLKKLYLFNKKGDKLFILTETENFYLNLQ
ncbi:PEGA domain-containing protein [bacterium]|jgi:hypothetical protein|nr:PEGA domain-containing protein [bacterium]MBT4649040.1 PEGA domain-containing protein [bacterium]